jgi:hypothetical protein
MIHAAKLRLLFQYPKSMPTFVIFQTNIPLE